MRTLFLIAIRNLFLHRRRSLMLGGAIAGVTALLVFFTCLASGVRQTMLRSALTVSTGHLNVGGFYKITAGQSAPLVTDYKKIQAIVEKTLPDVDFVAPRGRGWARLVGDNGNIQVGIAGVELEREPMLPKVLKMKEGTLADLAQAGSILLFASQAKKLKVKTGDSLVFSVLTPRGVNNTVDVRVIGVAEDMGMLTDWSVIVPIQTLRALYQMNPETTGALLVYLKDMRRIPQARELLRTALTKAGYEVMDDGPSKPFWMKLQETAREEWTGQKLALEIWEDEISFVSWSLKAIEGIAFLLTTVLLVIIAVGIMNTLWIAIRERTREIGTLRAIGMQRPRVLAMFVVEAFSLSVFGTVAGVVLGVLLSAFVNLLRLPVPEGARFFTMSEVLRLGYEPSRIFGGALVIVVCTTAVSLFPALRAARMKPVTAMSHI